jgi:hypothetical protein
MKSKLALRVKNRERIEYGSNFGRLDLHEEFLFRTLFILEERVLNKVCNLHLNEMIFENCTACTAAEGVATSWANTHSKHSVQAGNGLWTFSRELAME